MLKEMTRNMKWGQRCSVTSHFGFLLYKANKATYKHQRIVVVKTNQQQRTKKSDRARFLIRDLL